jgi:TetR/AcrR family transcriptional regulator, transcriptional repressor for nem operon
MKQDTKQRLLEIGAETMHLKGYNHTGIQEILNLAGVPKGSFYNYFKSKEDFGLQIIDYFVEFYVRQSNQFFEDGSKPPLERIRLFLRSFMDFFRERDFAYGCPIGNFAQEMGDLSQPFREKLRIALDVMARQYEIVLQEARRKGDLPEPLDLKETAHFIVTSWQGALMWMKVAKSTEPLETHMKFIFDHVLKVRCDFK